MRNACGQKMHTLFASILIVCSVAFLISSCDQSFEVTTTENDFSITPPVALTGDVPPPKPNGDNPPPERTEQKGPPPDRRFSSENILPPNGMLPPNSKMAPLDMTPQQEELFRDKDTMIDSHKFAPREISAQGSIHFTASKTSSRTFMVSTPYSYTENAKFPSYKCCENTTISSGIPSSLLVF